MEGKILPSINYTFFPRTPSDLFSRDPKHLSIRLKQLSTRASQGLNLFGNPPYNTAQISTDQRACLTSNTQSSAKLNYPT